MVKSSVTLNKAIYKDAFRATKESHKTKHKSILVMGFNQELRVQANILDQFSE